MALHGEVMGLYKAESQEATALESEISSHGLIVKALRAQSLMMQLWQQLDSVSSSPAGTFARSQMLGTRRRVNRAASDPLWGNVVYFRYPSEDAVTVFIPTDGAARRSHSTAEDVEARAAFGVTAYRSGARTVFWVPAVLLRWLLRRLEHADWATVNLATAVDDEGRIHVQRFDPPRVSATQAWQVLGPASFKVAQLYFTDAIFTWEATKASEGSVRRSFCSIRGDAKCVERWIERLQPTLPVSYDAAIEVLRSSRGY